MTHTPDQIRRAAEARDAYRKSGVLTCSCCGTGEDWLAVADAVTADVLAQQPRGEWGGKWVPCDDVPPHEHPAGAWWRETRIVGGAWKGREHWEPADPHVAWKGREHWEPADPHVAVVTEWASGLGLSDENVRELLARLDATKEG